MVKTIGAMMTITEAHESERSLGSTNNDLTTFALSTRLMYQITNIDLAVGFIPVLITLGIIFYQATTLHATILAILRMLVQLLLIGYALDFIFNTNSGWTILLVLMFMIIVASWISLNALPIQRKSLLLYSFVAIFLGGVPNLILVSQGVLHVSPWYQPASIIPLAGMLFSSAMNAISLAGERLFSELEHGTDYTQASGRAFQAAMIPITNALLAIGLVSLPGTMTGQILAGTSPLIASRYQIVVLCMTFSASGVSASLFLWLLKRENRQSTHKNILK